MSFDASHTVARESVNNPRNHHHQQQKPPVYKGMSSVVFTFTAAVSLKQDKNITRNEAIE